MTRNIWIGIVVVIVLVAGGWWYFTQSSAPATSETTQLPTQQAAQQKTPTTAVTATIDSISNSSAPTIAGTLKNMNGSGDLSIVIVKNKESLPMQTTNPAKLPGSVDYGTSGMGGDIDTDYKSWYSYKTATLSPGTYTVGLYLNTLFVRGADYKGFQLLTNKTFDIQ